MHLDALPDDILLLVIELLALSSAHPGHYQLPYGDWEHPLISISATNWRFRQLAIPWLYRHIEIKGLPREMFLNGCRVNGSWEKALAHAQGMLHCQGMMRHVRSFKFDFYVREGKFVPPPEARLVPSLVKLISTMTRLEILELQIEDHRWQAKVAPEFRREFESANLILPTVRTLIFSRYFEWLVFKCPNARRIQTKDRWFHNDLFDSLIKTAAIVKDLEYFEINAWQDERLAQALVATMPHLKSLAIAGDFIFSDAKFPFATNNALSGLLQGLSGFKTLKFLHLGSANICFSFGDPGLPIPAEEEKRLCIRAEDFIAKMALAQCASLQTIRMSQRFAGTCSSPSDLRQRSSSEYEQRLRHFRHRSVDESALRSPRDSY